MKIGIDTAELSKLIVNGGHGTGRTYSSRHLVYNNKGRQYGDNPYYTWEAFVLCLMNAEYDSEIGCMACRMNEADFSVLFKSTCRKDGVRAGFFIDRWTSEGKHDNFHRFFIYDEQMRSTTKIISSVSLKDGFVAISYDGSLTEDIKRFKGYFNKSYLDDLVALESIEGILLYHLLFSELKKLSSFMGQKEIYYIELTDLDMIARGFAADIDFEGLLEETRDEINALTHIWYEFDVVLDEKPDQERTNDMCYRIILGQNSPDISIADMQYEEQMQMKRECMAALSIILKEPVDTDKMLNILEAANYNLSVVKSVYDCMHK